MMDNLWKERSKEEEAIFSVKVHGSMANGKMITKSKENFFFSMEMFLKGSFRIISGIKVFTITRMEIFIKGFGKMILSKDLESLPYL